MPSVFIPSERSMLSRKARPTTRPSSASSSIGGNDANNTLIPFDTTGYANYSTIRGPLAMAQNTLLPLTPAAELRAQSQSARHPVALQQQQRRHRHQRRDADPAHHAHAVSSPTRTCPTNLFSHPDQQLEWQNASQSGATPPDGPAAWPMRSTSRYNPNATIPMITSVDGDTLFCNGNRSTPVSVSPGNLGGASCSEGTPCAPRNWLPRRRCSPSDSGLSLVQADNAITSNAYKYAQILTAARSRVPAADGIPSEQRSRHTD